MVEVMCINDRNKPKEIPSEKWVKERNLYTITHLYWHPDQKVMSCKLRELNIDEGYEPYNAFMLKRFAILQADLEKFRELAEACSDLNNVDLDEMIEELFGEELVVTEEELV